MKLTSLLRGLFRLGRPKHWIKNAFILMPVPFAMASGAEVKLLIFGLGLMGFSLINSAVYSLNDVLDAPADRLHSLKAQRPVASGLVSIPAAVVFSLTLSVVGLLLLWLTGLKQPVILSAVYLIINIAYSATLKSLALVDVFVVTAGFVIRVMLGCALVEAVPSNWLLLCSSCLALFLSFGKRRAEFVSGINYEHRYSLQGYNLPFLDHAMTMTACLVLISYALYTMESNVLLPGRELVTMPFVAYGVMFYLREAFLNGAGGSPVDFAFRSRTGWACLLGWALGATWGLGLW